jgi:hypothetical protein
MQTKPLVKQTYDEFISKFQKDQIFVRSRRGYYGLYWFTTLNSASLYDSIETVELCPDADFYCGDSSFLTNKIVCTGSYRYCAEFLSSLQPEMLKTAISQNGCLVKCVDQTEEICKLAVQQNGYALEYVRNQTEEICKLAVKQNGYALQYVKNQTEEICKLAVQQKSDALSWIKNQTEEICKFALQQDWWTLRNIKNQTDKICEFAVQQNGLALQYVKNQTEEICKLAVQQNPQAFQYIIN